MLLGCEFQLYSNVQLGKFYNSVVLLLLLPLYMCLLDS